MKFKIQNLSYLLFVGLIGFSSCKDDDEDTVKPKTAFTTTKTDTLWNAAGPFKGSYDLMTMTNKGSSDADGDKDMSNPTTAADLSSGTTFRREFMAKNSTKFYSLGSSFNFDGAYKEQIDSIYKANTSSAVSSVSGVLTNGVYIANLRGAGSYAVIKIVSIKDDGLTLATGGDNKDYILFTYKK